MLSALGKSLGPLGAVQCPFADTEERRVLQRGGHGIRLFLLTNSRWEIHAR